MFLFGGHPPTVNEMSRKYRRQIARAHRDLDKENQRLQSEERKALKEIKQSSQNNLSLSVQKAKSVVRIRHVISKISNLKANFEAIEMSIQHVQSVDVLQKTMSSTCNLVKAFNHHYSCASVMKNLQELQFNTAMMSNKCEVIDDQMDLIFEDEEENEESESLIVQVMEDAGVIYPSTAKNMDSLENLLSATSKVRDVA